MKFAWDLVSKSKSRRSARGYMTEAHFVKQGWLGGVPTSYRPEPYQTAVGASAKLGGREAITELRKNLSLTNERVWALGLLNRDNIDLGPVGIAGLRMWVHFGEKDPSVPGLAEAKAGLARVPDPDGPAVRAVLHCRAAQGFSVAAELVANKPPDNRVAVELRRILQRGTHQDAGAAEAVLTKFRLPLE
jgi:hypothetical protein